MSILLAANALEFAMQEANPAGKVVLGALFIGSIFSWSVMITKLRTIVHAKNQSGKFLDLFRSNRAPLNIFEARLKFEGAPVFAVYKAGCKEMTFQLLGSAEVDETFKDRLDNAAKVTSAQMRVVTSAMERAVGETALKLESQMILLATAVSGAPFLAHLG